MPTQEIVRAALLNEPIDYAEFKRQVEWGLLLNDYCGEERITPIPQVSQAALLFYANTEEEPLASNLKQLCLMDISPVSDDNSACGKTFLGPQFEKYHAQWKVVRSLVRGTWSGPLHDYYGNGTLFNTEFFKISQCSRYSFAFMDGRQHS